MFFQVFDGGILDDGVGGGGRVCWFLPNMVRPPGKLGGVEKVLGVTLNVTLQAVYVG